MSREEGFYWVFYVDEWVICKWSGESWWVPCNEHYFYDDDFDQINERKIENPNE